MLLCVIVTVARKGKQRDPDQIVSQEILPQLPLGRLESVQKIITISLIHSLISAISDPDRIFCIHL